MDLSSDGMEYDHKFLYSNKEITFYIAYTDEQRHIGGISDKFSFQCIYKTIRTYLCVQQYILKFIVKSYSYQQKE